VNKNIEIIMRVIAKLVKEGKPFVFIIGGDNA
jgi:arginase family enzyme